MGKDSNSSSRSLGWRAEGCFELVAKATFSSKQPAYHRGTYWGDRYWTPAILSDYYLTK